MRPTFVKKSSCLVARIVSFDTAGLRLLTYFRYFRALPIQRYSLDLNHSSNINGIITLKFLFESMFSFPAARI